MVYHLKLDPLELHALHEDLSEEAHLHTVEEGEEPIPIRIRKLQMDILARKLLGCPLLVPPSGSYRYLNAIVKDMYRVLPTVEDNTLTSMPETGYKYSIIPPPTHSLSINDFILMYSPIPVNVAEYLRQRAKCSVSAISAIVLRSHLMLEDTLISKGYKQEALFEASHNETIGSDKRFQDRLLTRMSMDFNTYRHSTTYNTAGVFDRIIVEVWYNSDTGNIVIINPMAKYYTTPPGSVTICNAGINYAQMPVKLKTIILRDDPAIPVAAAEGTEVMFAAMPFSLHISSFEHMFVDNSRCFTGERILPLQEPFSVADIQHLADYRTHWYSSIMETPKIRARKMMWVLSGGFHSGSEYYPKSPSEQERFHTLYNRLSEMRNVVNSNLPGSIPDTYKEIARELVSVNRELLHSVVGEVGTTFKQYDRFWDYHLASHGNIPAVLSLFDYRDAPLSPYLWNYYASRIALSLTSNVESIRADSCFSPLHPLNIVMSKSSSRFENFMNSYKYHYEFAYMNRALISILEEPLHKEIQTLKGDSEERTYEVTDFIRALQVIKLLPDTVIPYAQEFAQPEQFDRYKGANKFRIMTFCSDTLQSIVDSFSKEFLVVNLSNLLNRLNMSAPYYESRLAPFVSQKESGQHKFLMEIKDYYNYYVLNLLNVQKLIQCRGLLHRSDMGTRYNKYLSDIVESDSYCPSDLILEPTEDVNEDLELSANIKAVFLISTPYIEKLSSPRHLMKKARGLLCREDQELLDLVCSGENTLYPMIELKYRHQPAEGVSGYLPEPLDEALGVTFSLQDLVASLVGPTEEFGSTPLMFMHFENWIKTDEQMAELLQNKLMKFYEQGHTLPSEEGPAVTEIGKLMNSGVQRFLTRFRAALLIMVSMDIQYCGRSTLTVLKVKNR